MTALWASSCDPTKSNVKEALTGCYAMLKQWKAKMIFYGLGSNTGSKSAGKNMTIYWA